MVSLTYLEPWHGWLGLSPTSCSLGTSPHDLSNKVITLLRGDLGLLQTTMEPTSPFINQNPHTVSLPILHSQNIHTPALYETSFKNCSHLIVHNHIL